MPEWLFSENSPQNEEELDLIVEKIVNTPENMHPRTRSGLRYTIRELMANAFEAAEQAPDPQVRVELIENGGLLKSVVVNNGFSVSENDPGGAGIGLREVRQLVINLGGQLNIEGTDSKTTVSASFWVD